MVERILRAYYEMKTSFSMFAHRRLFYEIINLAMMSICVANINLNQAQLVIYSIGIIVASTSLVYIFILEDMYPFLLLDPLIEFSSGLTFERYVLMLIDASNNSGSNDILEKKLGITDKETLCKKIDEIQSRLTLKNENMKKIVLASLPMVVINLTIFLVNMTYYCDDSPNYTCDLSSVMCIIEILAQRHDWLAVIRDNFVITFSETANSLKKNV